MGNIDQSQFSIGIRYSKGDCAGLIKTSPDLIRFNAFQNLASLIIMAVSWFSMRTTVS